MVWQFCRFVYFKEFWPLLASSPQKQQLRFIGVVIFRVICYAKITKRTTILLSFDRSKMTQVCKRGAIKSTVIHGLIVDVLGWCDLIWAFDWVSLASVGSLVSGSAPAARSLLGCSLKWCSSSSVQITPFNWTPVPWPVFNHSSLSLTLCMSAFVFLLQCSHFSFPLHLFLCFSFTLSFSSFQVLTYIFWFSKYFLGQWWIFSEGKVPQYPWGAWKAAFRRTPGWWTLCNWGKLYSLWSHFDHKRRFCVNPQ